MVKELLLWNTLNCIKVNILRVKVLININVSINIQLMTSYSVNYCITNLEISNRSYCVSCQSSFGKVYYIVWLEDAMLRYDLCNGQAALTFAIRRLVYFHSYLYMFRELQLVVLKFLWFAFRAKSVRWIHYDKKKLNKKSLIILMKLFKRKK